MPGPADLTLLSSPNMGTYEALSKGLLSLWSASWSAMLNLWEVIFGDPSSYATAVAEAEAWVVLHPLCFGNMRAATRPAESE